MYTVIMPFGLLAYFSLDKTDMDNKKIIKKNDVRENNPNDDEEIVKNQGDKEEQAVQSEDKKTQIEKQQGSETIGIP